MLVPAIAFGWWLASIPMPTLAAAVPVEERAAEPAPEAQQEDEQSQPAPKDADPAPVEPTHERVKLRGPVTPEMVRMARSFLDLPMGAEREAEVNGVQCVFVLEWHYHPPGFHGGPNGWHKGVTVYERR